MDPSISLLLHILHALLESMGIDPPFMEDVMNQAQNYSIETLEKTISSLSNILAKTTNPTQPTSAEMPLPHLIEIPFQIREPSARAPKIVTHVIGKGKEILVEEPTQKRR